MSQSSRSRSAVAASRARFHAGVEGAATPEGAESAPTSVAATAPAPSNAPTIFLLILVVGMMGFIAWWAFLGKGARATTNAVLPLPPRLDAVPARVKPSPKPVPAATTAPKSAASNETAPVISEVPAPARRTPVKGGTASTDAD